MLSRPERLWYAIRVKSNREKITSAALQGKNYEVLVPSYRECRARGKTTRSVEVPLFAGYIFCRFDVNERLPVLTVPGVVHIVGTGRTPEPVDPTEMDGVLTLSKSRLEVSPFAYPPIGDRIRVHDGPLRGVEGTVIAHKGCEKLVVSVSLLQRSIAVDVDRQWIASPRRCGTMS